MIESAHGIQARREQESDTARREWTSLDPRCTHERAQTLVRRLRHQPQPVSREDPVLAAQRSDVRNGREGDEVVQLYIRDVLASVAQPVMALEGFRRVRLKPGQSTEVAFTIGPRELRLLDANLNWVVEPGAFRIMVGASSRDIRLRGQLTVR